MRLALTDADNDGVIPVGSSLALFTGSSVAIDNVSALKSAGTVEIDDTTYYAYASAGPGGGAHAAVVHSALQAQAHDLPHFDLMHHAAAGADLFA